jgi:hypothetical protein
MMEAGNPAPGSLVKRMMLLVFLLGVLPLAIYGIYTQIQFSRKVQPIITATLVDPYAKAVNEGRYEEAYRNFTSPAFQSTYGLEDFLKAQAETRDKLGLLTRIQARSSFSAAGNLFDDRRFFRGELTYLYEKGEVLVVWEISQQGDTYKIDAQFEDLTETLRPGIF